MGLGVGAAGGGEWRKAVYIPRLAFLPQHPARLC